MRTRIITAVAVAALALTGCGNKDNTARQDLPVDAQHNDLTDAQVIVMPDGYPNIAHKCQATTGFWTTTDRTMIIVYNDRACGGEGEMLVVNGTLGRANP